MKNLLLVSFMLLLAIGAAAQDKKGDVVVHAPAGLDALLKKKHATAKRANATLDKQEKVPAAPKMKMPVKAVADRSPSTASATVTHAAAKADKPAEVKPGAQKEPTPRLVGTTRWKGSGSIYSGKGFRVQIYYGPDRSKAIKIKTEFMRLYPDVRTYLTYISPCFRVKVGNYRNRSDAAGMLKEASSSYSPCMIVPDIITIKTF